MSQVCFKPIQYHSTVKDSCHDANCTWRSFTTRAFCNSLLHIRDSLECLKTNILPVPLPITLAEMHHISISHRCGSPLAIGSPRPCCLYWRQKENMKETIKHEASELSLAPAECKVLSELQLNLILWCAVLPTGKVILSTHCGSQ